MALAPGETDFQLQIWEPREQPGARVRFDRWAHFKRKNYYDYTPDQWDIIEFRLCQGLDFILLLGTGDSLQALQIRKV